MNVPKPPLILSLLLILQGHKLFLRLHPTTRKPHQWMRGCRKSLNQTPSQTKKKSVILSLYMIKIISNRKTTKMRYCEYSYGVNCVFSFQLCFVMHPLLQIMSTKNNTNGISETTGKVHRSRPDPPTIISWRAVGASPPLPDLFGAPPHSEESCPSIFP